MLHKQVSLSEQALLLSNEEKNNTIASQTIYAYADHIVY